MKIVILGKSGSGKTTVVDIITENFRYDKVVTNTSRPMREGEVEGVDYNFLTDEEFDTLIEQGEFVEYFIAGNGWKYGTSKESLEKDDIFIILTPSGLDKLKEGKYDIVSIYVDVDDKTRYIRQLERGDDIKEVCRRSITDENDFKNIEDKVDFIVHNDTNDVWNCVNEVLQLMSKINK